MELPKNPLNPSIGNEILTLRYNSNLKSTLNKLSWKDFQPLSNPVSIDFLEQCMENYIKKQNLESQKKISIALSGGVESTLSLAIIRKMYPNLEINAFSIKFAVLYSK